MRTVWYIRTVWANVGSQLRTVLHIRTGWASAEQTWEHDGISQQGGPWLEQGGPCNLFCSMEQCGPQLRPTWDMFSILKEDGPHLGPRWDMFDTLEHSGPQLNPHGANAQVTRAIARSLRCFLYVLFFVVALWSCGIGPILPALSDTLSVSRPDTRQPWSPLRQCHFPTHESHGHLSGSVTSRHTTAMVADQTHSLCHVPTHETHGHLRDTYYALRLISTHQRWTTQWRVVNMTRIQIKGPHHNSTRRVNCTSYFPVATIHLLR